MILHYGHELDPYSSVYWSFVFRGHVLFQGVTIPHFVHSAGPRAWSNGERLVL